MESSDSGIPQSKRSRSPYHKKCVPPFVDSNTKVNVIKSYYVSQLEQQVATSCSPHDAKIVGQIDKHLVSKLDRSELEDRYIVLADENLSLKRLLNEHQKKIQRLCAQLQRQEVIDKKEGRNTASIWNENQINVLFQQNRVLQAKVNVLTQQLQSHSRMHARVHRSHHSKVKCTSVLSPNHREGHTVLEKYTVKSLPATGEDVKDFQYLQQEFGVDNEEMDANVAELEREYTECALNENDDGNELEKVMDNVEMIRLRRCNKRQAVHIAALSDHLESAEKELQKLRKIVEKVSEESEQLTKQLQRERQKLREIQGSAVQSSTQAQAIKDLEEQIRDLQNEKKSLKDYNQKLLELTQKSGGDEATKYKLHPEKKVDTSSKINAHEIQKLKEKIITLQNKLDESVKNNTVLEEESRNLLDEYKKETVKLKEDNYELQKKLQDAVSEIGMFKKNQVSTSDVNDLKEGLMKQTRECEELKKHLECALIQNDNLRMEANNVTAEYRERVLEVEKEKDRLYEKLNEAQKKIENLEKHSTHIEAAGAGREIYSSEITLSENKRREMDTDDVALVIILLKEMNTELERCYNIISCQHEISKHLLVTIESFSVCKSASTSGVNEELHTEDKIVNLIAFEIKKKIEEEELCSTKKLFIAELKPLGLLEKHFSLISQQLHKIQLICPVIKPVMLQAIQVIQEPNKLQYRFYRRKENAKEEYKHEPALIKSIPLAAAEPVTAICQFEIYISKITFDRNSFNYLENIEKNPKVNLAWCFLDLHTYTSVRNARKACFESSTVYCGPLTKDVMECLEQNPVEVVCNVIENDDQSIAIAKGQIDVIEAFQNPGNTVKTSVMLTGDHVCGELFCWFCLHCDGENVKNQHSIRTEQGVEEASSTHIQMESGNIGERDYLPSSEWKLTSGDINALNNICHCHDSCIQKR